jgi:hypothetical protein
MEEFMFRSTRQLLLILLFLAVLSLSGSGAAASENSMSVDNSTPLFSSYKGISIGMTTEQVRASLGTPRDSSDATDFFGPSEHEFIQVYYEHGKVTALTITFNGNLTSAPTPKGVFGEDAEVKPDGGIFKMVRYPKAGFWISYNKIGGDEPIIIIAVKKI